MEKINCLDEILKNLQPKLNSGQYVFVVCSNIKKIPDLEDILCLFKEGPSISIIMEKSIADRLNLTYNYLAAWITLEVNSSLSAVGLTAMFSNELTKHEISCNVVAGALHDHIFVEYEKREKALTALLSLTNNH